MWKKHVAFLFIAVVCLMTNAFAQTFTLMHDGMERSYNVHLPASYDGSEKAPLVIAIHGWSRSPEKMEQHSQLSIKSDSAGFIVVYPKGTKTPLEWNTKDTGVDDSGFINAMLDTLIQNYKIDEKRVFVTGFSNGAELTYRLAYVMGDRIAAIAPVACAVVLENHTPNRPMPIMHFHAKNDGSVSFTSIALPAINYWRNFNGCVTEADTFFTTDGAIGIRWDHESENDAEVVLYLTDIGGHSWPGGLPSWSTPSSAISATDLMWDFFSAHPMEDETGVEEQLVARLAEDCSLLKNYPNPFNPVTNISFQLKKSSHVILSVYNLTGEKIITLISGEMQAGSHEIAWNGTNEGNAHVASGVYFTVLRTGNEVFRHKMLLMK